MPPAPNGASYSLTLFWSVEHPSKVYAHRSLGCHRLNVREDLGWNEHSKLKNIQFHQYPVNQVHEVELYDDGDLLRQGGIDSGIPQADEGGPHIESLDSSFEDPADIPVPDGDTDIDLEDSDFWTEWLAEIKADEYRFTEVYHAQQRRDAERVSIDARSSLAVGEAVAALLLRRPPRSRGGRRAKGQALAASR